MATHEKKVARRAEALKELQRLSSLLAEKFEIEVPNVLPTDRDPEMAQIVQVEAINDLLNRILGDDAKESLDGLTKAELLEKASEAGVEISKSATKAEIIEAIEAK